LGSSTQIIILSSPRPLVPHLGEAERSMPADASSNAFAERGFCVPENASMKKGLVATTGPEIHKVPYTHEGNLYREFIRI
jgi:hypothetical protein